MLHWFDSDPSRYWALAWAMAAAFGLAALAPILIPASRPVWARRVSRWMPPPVFIALLFLAFVAFRWPLFFLEEELNPDESQLIAGAITLQDDPVYWRSVNGTTHGPLDAYPLLLPRLFLLPLDYGSARLVGSALMLGSILGVFALLRRVAGEAVARVAILPLFCCLSFLSYWDLVHYSSEHVPVFLLALAAWLLGSVCLGLAPPASEQRRWLIGGIVLGAVPLAKLQGAPISAALFAAAIGGTAWTTRSWRLTLGRTATLALMSASVPLFFLLVTLLTGTTSYAWRAYIIQNIRYSGDRHYPLAEMVRNFGDFAAIAEGVYAFLAGGAAFAVAVVLRLPAFPPLLRRLVLFLAIFVLGAFAAVIFPGRQYTHYLLLLIVPAGMLAGALFAAAWETEHSARWPRALLLLAFLLVTVFPQVYSRARHPHPYVGRLAESQRTAITQIAQFIRYYGRRDEALGHWGWMSRYHVQTRMRQATQEAHAQLQVEGTPQREYFRRHYMKALRETRPPVFIDTVGPGNFVFEDRQAHGHETWEELRRFIAGNYTFVADLEGTRIYARNDRVRQSP